jgi:hypothetical protein
MSVSPLLSPPPSLPAAAKDQRTTQTASPTLRLLMLAALYAIPLLVAVRPVGEPVLDPDIWWHLRVGQWVVENQGVPDRDPFSQLDRPWVAYSWLYEVLVFGLYKAFGLLGIVVYRSVMAVAVVAALHRLVRRRELHFMTATLLTAVGVLAVAMLFSERPWLFTILFTTLTVDTVLDLLAGRSTRLAWLLPAVFALWASLHIQLVYGLLVLAAGCAAPLLDAALGRGLDRAAMRKLGLLTIACFAATLVNPYHIRIYGVVLEYATQAGPFQFINELKALEFREASDWVMLALAGAAAFALGRHRRLETFEVLLLVGAAILAFRARRDMWLAVLAALAVLARCRQTSVSAEARFSPTRMQRAAVTVMLLCLTGLLAWQRQLTPERLEARVAEVFPMEAARVVAERGYAGPLFNDFNWGGYLIWSLPHLPVVLDGRTNLHGDERIVRIGNVWAGGAGWHDDPDLAAAGVVLADTSSPLAELLEKDGRFVRVHADKLARVFVRVRADATGH